MFRKACALARGFTWPLVISFRRRDGRCGAAVGTCVIVNSNGWFVTAGHILTDAAKFVAEAEATAALDGQVAAINANTALGSGEKRRQLKALPRQKPTDITHASVWHGRDSVLLREAYTMPLDLSDIGVGRIEPFDPAWVPTYPIFKDPTKDFEPGTSLCRMGFPFHKIGVTFDATNNQFVFDPGAVPMPIFPIEGIFTRTMNIILAPGPGKPAVTPPWPLAMIETSSPGIPGQSGGPIFDMEGRIWGIQSSTASYSLDLKTPEKQYLNVGLGVHPETIFGFLNERKVAFQVSQH